MKIDLPEPVLSPTARLLPGVRLSGRDFQPDRWLPTIVLCWQSLPSDCYEGDGPETEERTVWQGEPVSEEGNPAAQRDAIDTAGDHLAERLTALLA